MSGRIPQSFINDLLERVDILEVVDARVKLKRTGKNYVGLCPFHNEKTGSFSVSPDKQFYYCFSCKASGTVLTFLMEYEGLDFVTAVESLASIAGVAVPREAGKAPHADKGEQNLYQVMERAALYYQQMLKNHEEAVNAVDYLKNRGLTGLSARDFGMGFAPSGWSGLSSALKDVGEADLVSAGLAVKSEKGRVYDRFRNRIMFPIRDLRGRVVAFGGRVLADEQPKYMNSPETPIFHKSRELYGLYEARRAVRRLDSLLLVEGYMDVIALAQHGVPNAVATLGTATSEEHLTKLYRYASEVVCCFDGDKPGRDAAWKTLELALPVLSEGRQLKFMFLPEGDDPDSLAHKEGKDQFQHRVAEAMPCIEYMFRRLTEQLDLDLIDDRARLGERAIPYIKQVPEGLLRQLMMNRLSMLTLLPQDALYASAGIATQTNRQSSSHESGPDMRADNRYEANNPTDASQKTRPSRISKYLLGILLKHPEYLGALDDEVRTYLLNGLPEDSLFRTVVHLLDSHPDLDTATLLAALSGERYHALLVELAQAPAVLDEKGLKADFLAGAEKLRKGADNARRKLLIQEIKKGGSADHLAAFWALKQGKMARDADEGPQGRKGETEQAEGE